MLPGAAERSQVLASGDNLQTGDVHLRGRRHCGPDRARREWRVLDRSQPYCPMSGTFRRAHHPLAHRQLNDTVSARTGDPPES